MNGNQMIILQSCLQKEFGSSIFATQHNIYQIVNLGYVEPVTGIFKFGSEHISWSYKAIEKCLMIWMETRQKKDNHKNNKAYKQIDICINTDHGKGHSRILAKFILRYQDYSRGVAWCEDRYLYSLVNYRCKKDNAKIIYNNFVTILDDELL